MGVNWVLVIIAFSCGTALGAMSISALWSDWKREMARLIRAIILSNIRPETANLRRELEWWVLPALKERR